MSPDPIRVLFVCTGNSARSQIAEALLRDFGSADFEVFSAGTEPKGVNPLHSRRPCRDRRRLVGLPGASQSTSSSASRSTT